MALKTNISPVSQLHVYEITCSDRNFMVFEGNFVKATPFCFGKVFSIYSLKMVHKPDELFFALNFQCIHVFS